MKVTEAVPWEGEKEVSYTDAKGLVAKNLANDLADLAGSEKPFRVEPGSAIVFFTEPRD